MRKGYLKNKGVAWIPLLLAGVAAGGILWYWFRGGLVAFALDILNLIAYIVLPITDFFFRTLSQLAATIINVFISLNPFADYGAASLLWEFFKNIAYVVIVFLALIAGFEWILNREDAARRLLLGLLLIAFLINFTFVLAKELFMAIWYLQIGILQSANLGGEKDSQFGSLLYAALSIVPPTEVANKIVNELSPRIAQQAQEQGAGAGSVHNIQVAINISGRLLGIFLNAIYSIIMWMFAGIAIGRFLILSFLVGVLPLACVAYTTPWYKSKWDEWWKMFFTWNVNILILIPLILIGIALIATQGSFNEVKIQELFLNPVTTRPFGTLTGDAALIIAIVIRSIFIALYFCFVVVVALTWGGRAADYGYRFGKWLWGSVIGGALLWAGKEVAGKPVLDKLGSGLEKLGDTLAMSRFGVFRSLGARVKDLGEGLRKPVKKDIETQAKAIWEQIKDKSPEEIAQIIQRYPVALQKEIAKLAEKEKGADELIKIAGNIDLQKAAKTGVLKNLCGRTFDCNLARLVTATEEEEKIRALNQIAGKLDWRTANLGDLSSVLTKAGIEPNRHPLLFTNMYTYVPNKRNFWTPENIRWLAQQGQRDFIEANLGTITTTPAYRAVVQGGAADIARVLGMDPKHRKVIEDALLNFYKSGKMETKLQEWGTNISQFDQDVLEHLSSQLTQELTQLNNELANLSTQENNIRQEQQKIEGELQNAEQILNYFRQYPLVQKHPQSGLTKSEAENRVNNLRNQRDALNSQLQDLDRRRNSIQANINAINTTLDQLRQIRQNIQSGQFPEQQQLQNLFVKLRGALKTPPPTGREERGISRRELEEMEGRLRSELGKKEES
jgi:predicted  nucleic acid-binding Zn-ribbon protein